MIEILFASVRKCGVCWGVLVPMTFPRTAVRCCFLACTPTLSWSRACVMNMTQVCGFSSDVLTVLMWLIVHV